MKKILDSKLNTTVANFAVFFTKLHHFHWFVKGPKFFELHKQFEALYEEVNELYDTFAERLITIGGKPASSLKQYLALTTLKESETLEPASMVSEVILDLKQLVKEMKETIELTSELKDDATEDLLISTIQSFEKKIWMFEAYQA
ncbi:DNA starvation/stationary phase protection protein [Acholeplasma equirhinis]|uniref:Dps family protein n=1 Tax=Acholeplasma equirhinis TaxID=555393 RepID=UPI00197AAF3E|nr:DNA starvation/stationary phase protection protein [Acholeplasma equirhinis]MBN3490854.1 DNA starvation/stationary phase protection protein [Acholeplasma equirhinis]